MERSKPISAKSIGEILLDQGFISRQQLETALAMQRRSGGHLGTILLEMGAITERQLAKALGIQWGLPYVDLSAVDIDPETVKLIPHSLAQRHKVIAIARMNNRLRLAIADPLNVIALDDVRLVTGLEVDPVVAAPEDIQQAIARFYGLGVDMEEVVRQVAIQEVNGEERTEEITVERLRTMVEEAPLVRLVNLIISQAILDGASDIHIEPHRQGIQVRYRIDGVLHDVMAPPKQLQAAIISRIKIMASMDIAERRVPQDGHIHLVVEGREYDLRVSTLPTVYGEKVVLRILDQASMRLNLSRLGMTVDTLTKWEALISKPYGMILVCGPTGSGKTTTLYATLNKLNIPEKNIVTVEDPVEYQLPRINQVQVNPRAGITFANGLRSILRQDPDIIMVGEIRDRETAEIAIQASLTGHLVLSTIHTNDAPGATTRLIDMGIEPFLITSSLIGVLAQRLVRTICESCKESYAPPPEALRRLDLEGTKEILLYRGKGCDRCRGTGYKGRTGIFELMVMDEEIAELVLRNRSLAEIRQKAISRGMRTLREDGIRKLLEGTTTVEELLRVVFVDEPSDR
ncbi:MAG: type II secretion system ATPase GspE [Armatimonadota bacterium]|nr:type II secretion system ATPase GspE [Armatimonadota bacterium]MDR5703246.1 type II secretion system ATPase GspE [Armatimonadota bacterium]